MEYNIFDDIIGSSPAEDDVLEISGGNEDIVGGSNIRMYNNNHKAVKKDEIVSGLIPDVISECALYLGKTQTCSTPEVVAKVATSIGVVFDMSSSTGNTSQVINTAKSKLGCNSEECVLVKLSSKIGDDVVKQELATRFHVKGPLDVNLLSNYNIDSVLKQWQIKFPDFFAYNFNMLNYASYSFNDGYVIDRPDTLATILFKDLYTGEYDNRQYRCAACVINSDKYQGNGKHWMALFVDARGSEYSVEFFNSSGNAPAAEWVNFMVKTKAQLEDIAGMKAKQTGGAAPTVSIVKACGIRHQHSRTECGVYSLFYIWARLNGVPVSYFNSNPVPDQHMFEFRQHLFKDSKTPIGGKFNYDDYNKKINIIWE